MTKPDSFDRFFALVQRVHEGTTARSENDLSSKLSTVFSGLELHTVIDSSGSTVSGGKRPDILIFVAEENANLVLPAEIVIECKKPDEVAQFTDLADAIVSDTYWYTKTLPYLRDNLSHVQYFAFTTFTEFAIFPVTKSVRNQLIAALKQRDRDCAKLRKLIRSQVRLFNLYDTRGTGSSSAEAWKTWIGTHCNPLALQPIPLSHTRNSIPVRAEEDLESLATKLAIFAAGTGESGAPSTGFFYSIRDVIGNDYIVLDPEVKRDLLIFIMSQHVDMNTSDAEVKVNEDVPGALDDFVAASIHSLISRLFALKVIEDAYCVGAINSLIEKDLWLFSVPNYDSMDSANIRSEVFKRIRLLTATENPVIRRLVQYGFFFDWIEGFIDSVLFRSLFETLSVHDFSEIEGDLLGRFYELYAQQTNRSKRRALGQYYTPLPVVEFMWHQAIALAEARGELEHITVLDPAMGSATFLAEGARTLADAKVSKFWERLVGFDVSAQILGIASVNLYMAVLSRLTAATAFEVDDLRLYATDTLDYESENHLKQLLPLITDAAHRLFLQQRVAISTRAKRKNSYRLVIGNPPYKNNSNLTLSQVAERFPRLLTSSVEHGGAQLRNIRDDYAWFVAAADFYIQDKGLVAFILSDSFAFNRSYEYFRAELLRNYHVRALVRLGEHIFPDVSYRTSFAIIILERREEPLDIDTESAIVPYTDLRGLADDTKSQYLGTNHDPRLLHLREIVDGTAELGITNYHFPSKQSRYSFYPAGDVTVRFADLPTLHDDSTEVIFIDTYPGIITAFDVLFKGQTEAELKTRIGSLFSVCQSSTSLAQLVRNLDELADDQGFSDREKEVLQALGTQIQQKSIVFDPKKIKRSFSGSISDSARWYPPIENVHFIYYEPALLVPRKQNPGKQLGWGSMNQWRDPLSHSMTPKLIYTTAKSPNHGYAAFVTDDEWFVKLHGGLSQQFHYAGLDNPGKSPTLTGIPNNLTARGEDLYIGLNEVGGDSDALLYYIAALWNSELAKELLAAVGTSMRPGIKIPKSTSEKQLAVEIAREAKSAREIVRLSQMIGTDQTLNLGAVFTSSFLEAFEITSVAQKSRRFLSQEQFRIPAGIHRRLEEALMSAELGINQLIETLYT
jgi:hypothetical protein